MNRRGVHLKLDKLEQFQSSPPTVKSPFVLLLVCDVTAITADVLGDFAEAALKQGMVYFCAWGLGCERAHDVVDETVVMNEIKSPPPPGDDCIMTTCHEDESLEDAFEFSDITMPTNSYIENCEDLLVVTVANSEWAATIDKLMES